MGYNASIDPEEAVARVKRINESVVSMNEGCKKILETLSEASEATNLKSVDAIHKSFAEVSKNMDTLKENMENVVSATEKYAAEVTDIDDEDMSIYDN